MMTPSLRKIENKIREDADLTKNQIYLLNFASIFLAILPTRVFVAISGDIMQIAIITVPFVIAFMVLMLSIDITFGIPTPPEALGNFSRRRQNFSKRLTFLWLWAIVLVLITLFAKSLAVWLVDYPGYVALIICRFAAFCVGGMTAVLLIKLTDIRDIFGYLSAGADASQYFRAMSGIRTPAQPPDNVP
jgi:hypothetical protein